jgi:hypothetical protein
MSLSRFFRPLREAVAGRASVTITATDTANSSLSGTVTASVGSASGGFNGLGGFFPGLFTHARRFF